MVKMDPNDILRERGEEGLRAEFDAAADRGPYKSKANGSALPRLIKTSGDFVRGFVPPDYLVDGLLQRQFIYSFTGQTGSGKTAVALLLSYCIAMGVAIGDREVQPGRVIYFAGENPDDVRQRWIAMAEHMAFDINSISVDFIEGVISLEELEERLRDEVADTGPAALIVIDTSAAYFLGEDENSNPAMGAYARRLRHLTKLSGGPTVLANCHPVKNASSDNLLPRGGGAFLAEMDGNLCSVKNDTLVSVHWQGKFRGSEFDPISFETRNATAERLKDRRGRAIYTVYAAQLSDREITNKNREGRDAEDKVLLHMLDAETPPSVAAIAEHLGFLSSKGKPIKSRAYRVLERLKRDRLITNERGDAFALTEKGKKTAQKARYNQAASGASYG